MPSSRRHILVVSLLFLFVSCMAQRKNKLANSLSPYLLQHAENPVDWYPWEEEAFQKARNENKLLLISIGYATCHWCHVMEKECFEDSAVAEIMNKHFVCIKVDREEHPEVDAYYMEAMQIMTGGGGWPLNVFALPDKRPVYGVTYLPKRNWISLCKQIAELYEKNPEKAYEYAVNLGKALKELNKVSRSNVVETPIFPHKALKKFTKNFDKEWGGEKRVPKFPLPVNWIFFLRYAHFQKDKNLEKHLELTLDKLHYGGIYDHIAGGFARYSTDRQWKIPHFEKMLYDNALLLQLYSEAFQKFHKESYKKVIEETAEFILKELYDAQTGAFYSALDADSEGEEGKFYVWTKKELSELLPEKHRELFLEFYNITEQGNFEHGKNVLFQTTSDKEFAEKHSLSLEEWQKIKEQAREILAKERNKRIRPLTDDKSIASWNALATLGFLYAYQVLKQEKYLHVAEKNVRFFEENLVKNGKIFRIYRKGKTYKSAVLEDYAYWIRAYLKLFEVTGKTAYYEKAKELLRTAEKNFRAENGYFHSTSEQETNIPLRKISLTDDVIPSPNAWLAEAYYLIGLYDEDPKFLQIAKDMTFGIAEEISEMPYLYFSFLTLWLKFEYPYFITILASKKAQKYFFDFREIYLPNTSFGLLERSEKIPSAFKDRYDNTQELTVYICRERICNRPVYSVAEALEFLTR